MPASSQFVDVLVLGAGAAGLMCAFEAGRRGRQVLLLDHGERPGRKILISGGGRCNFTNTGTRAENFLSENPHFARSALARFTPADMVALVEKHGVTYHEKTLGQLFCDDSARRIVTLLERECADANVSVRCGVRVLRVRQANAALGTGTGAARFLVETSNDMFACRTLVVATGGLSIPKMGATGIGYDIARQFGHRIVEPRPALVPLVFAPEDLADWSDLAGVSTDVVIGTELPAGNARSAQPAWGEGGNAEAGDANAGKGKAKGRTDENLEAGNRGGKDLRPARRAPNGKGELAPRFREKLLITHCGVSGPAVLQISSYWRPGAEIYMDLAPGMDVFSTLKARSAGRDQRAMLAELKRFLPARLADRWVELRLRERVDWSNTGIDRNERVLHGWRLRPAGTEGFAKAEVTVGGVDTRELDARTMESLRAPGLHFIGEVVDVTGWLGGYNFQWAWASAAACGRSL